MPYNNTFQRIKLNTYTGVTLDCHNELQACSTRLLLSRLAEYRRFQGGIHLQTRNNLTYRKKHTFLKYTLNLAIKIGFPLVVVVNY